MGEHLSFKDININNGDIIKTYQVQKDMIYELLILKEKTEPYFRIINLTKLHICTCKFDTLEDVKNDLIKYEDNGQIIFISKTESC
jgi:hypothetical protein